MPLAASLQRYLPRTMRAVVAGLAVAASGCASTGPDAPRTSQETATGAVGGALGAAGGAVGGAVLGAVAGLQCGMGAILCSPAMAMVYAVKGAVMAGEAGARGGVNLSRSASTPPPAESVPEKSDDPPVDAQAALDVHPGAGQGEAVAPGSPTSANIASARTGATPTGIPAAGSQWAYGVTDHLYGRPPIDVMVQVTRVDGSSIDEAVTSRGASQIETQRTVSAGTAGFHAHAIADGAELMEFAPYLLAASGAEAAAVPVTAEGYPVGTGFPEWIARAGSQVWEHVSVPAGTYRALRVDISGKRVRVPSDPNVSRSFEYRIWYAPDVQRYVRLEQKEWSIPDRQLSHNVVELLKFSPPP